MATRVYRRKASVFRSLVSADGSTEFPAEAGRYHLYAQWACPWSQRAIIARKLKRLEEVVGFSSPDPVREEVPGWVFTGGEYVDPVNGWSSLAEAYFASNPTYAGRISSPVLWDTVTETIVSNESADILRSFDTGFGALADDTVVLRPAALAAEMDELDARLYEHVNNGVYRAGFTNDQAEHDGAVRGVFAMLDELDARLATRRFLFGAEPVETDWRFFVTLVRFDPVYAVHFKCTLRRIADYPSLSGYLRDLYQWPGIAETVRMGDIMRHYYLTHPEINPSRIVPLVPAFDLAAPHGREALG